MIIKLVINQFTINFQTGPILIEHSRSHTHAHLVVGVVGFEPT